MKHLNFIANSKSNKKNRVEELQDHIIAFNSAYKLQLPFGDTKYLSILVQPKLVLGDSGRVFLHWEVSSFDGKFSERDTEILLSKKENIIVLPNNNSKSIDNIEHTFSIGRLFAPNADEIMVFIDYAGKGMNLALNFDDNKQKLSINDQAESVLALIRSKQDKVLSFYSHSFGGMVLSLTLRHLIDNDLRINKIIANGFAKDKNSMAHSKAGKIYKFFDGWLIGRNNINKFALLSKYLKAHPETKAVIINHELDPFLKEAAWLDPKEALDHKNLQMIVLQGGKKLVKMSIIYRFIFIINKLI
jgi:hypothetical protein